MDYFKTPENEQANRQSGLPMHPGCNGDVRGAELTPSRLAAPGCLYSEGLKRCRGCPNPNTRDSLHQRRVACNDRSTGYVSTSCLWYNTQVLARGTRRYRRYGDIIQSILEASLRNHASSQRGKRLYPWPWGSLSQPRSRQNDISLNKTPALPSEGF